MIDAVQNDFVTDESHCNFSFKSLILEKFFTFLESFSVKKLQAISKLFNVKVKNVMLDNFIDVQETSVNVNPLYSHLENLESYQDKFLSGKYQAVTASICEEFSAFMVSHMITNRKRFKSYMNKREIIFKILKRLQALLKSCLILESDARQRLTNLAQDTSASTNTAQQRSLLGFFKFNSSQNIENLRKKEAIQKPQSQPSQSQNDDTFEIILSEREESDFDIGETQMLDDLD
jgi:hypothetical protein